MDFTVDSIPVKSVMKFIINQQMKSAVKSIMKSC